MLDVVPILKLTAKFYDQLDTEMRARHPASDHKSVQVYGYDYSAYGYQGYYDPADPYAGYYAAAYGQQYDPNVAAAAGRSHKDCHSCTSLIYLVASLGSMSSRLSKHHVFMS